MAMECCTSSFRTVYDSKRFMKRHTAPSAHLRDHLWLNRRVLRRRAFIRKGVRLIHTVHITESNGISVRDSLCVIRVHWFFIIALHPLTLLDGHKTHGSTILSRRAQTLRKVYLSRKPYAVADIERKKEQSMESVVGPCWKSCRHARKQTD